MKFEACIGLETHVMQKTRTKMFCGCLHTYGAEPNTHVCPVCLGYPGALPVLNAKAIELCCRAGLMLGCTINRRSRWDRKNYFYPDMAKNYQISQAGEPLCLGGSLSVEIEGEPRIFTIERIHQEENAAKNTHVAGGSLVDYNRAGTALMEIVSTPCMHSSAEALAYMNEIRRIMQYGGISDCDLEKGHMRSDVNVSIRPVGSEELGAKVEIKNMNSFGFIVEAIEFEIARQTAVVEGGGTVVQETRGYDPDRGETFSQRTKEDAHDYRYFPEPDLLPVEISDAQIARWRADLPELPAQRRRRYVDQLALPAYDAGVLTADKQVSDFFDAQIAVLEKQGRLSPETAKRASNLLMGKGMSLMTETGCFLRVASGMDDGDPHSSALTPAAAAECAALLAEGVLSSNAASELYEVLFREGGDPKVLIEQRGLVQVNDDDALDRWADEAIANNSKAVSDYRAGNAASINALMGFVMKQSRGKANPPAVIALLKKKLESSGATGRV